VRDFVIKMNDSAMLRDWQLAQDVSRRMKEQPTPKSLSSALFVLLLTLPISCGPAPIQTSGAHRPKASRGAPSAQTPMEFFRDLPRLSLIDSDGNPLPVLVPADAPPHTVANSDIGILRAPEFFTAGVFAGAEELLHPAIALTGGNRSQICTADPLCPLRT
jgi:hypothetical protein